MLKEEVDAEDVAEVVANWTGIPVSRMMESDVQKLIHMEDRLKQRVIGQDEGIQAVSSALRRARSGLQDPNRPIGSFIFLGPTGVGKTGTGQGAGRIHVRQRTGHDPDRHVGIHGKAFCGQADRRPPGMWAMTRRGI